MATTDKDFVVKAGLKVATGVTFPDNTTQSTASLTVGSTFPASPANGQLFLYTVTERIYYYLGNEWYPIANYTDAQYEYDGNGMVYPTLFAKLNGGAPNSTYTALPSADGGTPNEQF